MVMAENPAKIAGCRSDRETMKEINHSEWMVNDIREFLVRFLIPEHALDLPKRLTLNIASITVGRREKIKNIR